MAFISFAALEQTTMDTSGGDFGGLACAIVAVCLSTSCVARAIMSNGATGMAAMAGMTEEPSARASSAPASSMLSSSGAGSGSAPGAEPSSTSGGGGSGCDPIREASSVPILEAAPATLAISAGFGIDSNCSVVIGLMAMPPNASMEVAGNGGSAGSPDMGAGCRRSLRCPPSTPGRAVSMATIANRPGMPGRRFLLHCIGAESGDMPLIGLPLEPRAHI